MRLSSEGRKRAKYTIRSITFGLLFTVVFWAVGMTMRDRIEKRCELDFFTLLLFIFSLLFIIASISTFFIAGYHSHRSYKQVCEDYENSYRTILTHGLISIGREFFKDIPSICTAMILGFFTRLTFLEPYFNRESDNLPNITQMCNRRISTVTIFFSNLMDILLIWIPCSIVVCLLLCLFVVVCIFFYISIKICCSQDRS